MKDEIKLRLEDEIKLYLILTLKNIAALSCFTILAIVFNKWWIVLFSILFYSSISSKENNDERRNKRNIR